jgi:hypothetical protein
MDSTDASQRYLELLKGCLTSALFLEEERWPVGWAGWAKQKRQRNLIAARVQNALDRRLVPGLPASGRGALPCRHRQPLLGADGVRCERRGGQAQLRAVRAARRPRAIHRRLVRGHPADRPGRRARGAPARLRHVLVDERGPRCAVPQAVPGFVIVDDYELEPCRRAVDDYRAAHGVTEPIEPATPNRPDDPRGSWWRLGDR